MSYGYFGGSYYGPQRNYNVIYPLLFALVVAFGMLAGAKMHEDNQKEVNKNKAPQLKVGEVMSYINNAYVDEVNNAELGEKAISGMLKNLDPHSVYIPAKKQEQLNQPLKGNFEGIGVEFNILKDTIIVVSPISGGPSEEVGIKAGDKIIKIKGEDVAGEGITNQDVIDQLRGKKGSKVNVTVSRKGVNDPMKFTITRDKIPLKSVDATYMENDHTGYIKINRFSAKTSYEFNNALDQLKDQGIENLILDLRENPGGYLKAAINIADQFLKDEKMIVYTKGRARDKKVYKTSGDGKFQDGKLSILVDRGSASASEIISGAVQDHDRGLVVGRRTFGKGLVQEPYELKDGSVVRLTVARYYTPTGRCIQKPYDNGIKEYHKELIKRDEQGELMHKDSIEFADSLKYKTPEGRVVYGGGGIMPDIFVPMDTSERTQYLKKLLQKGLMNEYALNYVNDNRKSLKNDYDSPNDFIENFKTRGPIMNAFVNFADRKGVDYNRSKIQTSWNTITTTLKALIARQIWEGNVYFKIRNQNDNSYQKALELIKEDAFAERNLRF